MFVWIVNELESSATTSDVMLEQFCFDQVAVGKFIISFFGWKRPSKSASGPYRPTYSGLPNTCLSEVKLCKILC